MSTSHIVYFATNRNLVDTEKRDDFGETFNPDGPAALRFGQAEAPESCFAGDKRLMDIRIDVASERLEAPDGRKPVLGSIKIFEAVRRETRSEKRDVALFVHGYANTFRNALRHAALLRATYSAIPLAMSLVSWPSDGTMLPYMSYYSDRTGAKRSGLAMGHAFIKIADYLNGKRPDEWCGQRLRLMAHSMGNPDRRGSDGPRLADDLPRKLTLVDCRDVARSDARDEHGHDHHRYGPEVVADVNAVLKVALPDEIPGRVHVPEARAYRIQRSRRRTTAKVAPAT